MLRLKNLTNKFQKRTLRVLYGQTQAYPYAATLDPTIGTGSTFVRPLSTDTVPVTRSASAFVLKNGLVPGTVMIKVSSGDAVWVASGADPGASPYIVNSASADFTPTALSKPFGLLANFVGGDLDELGDENTVGVWRGVGAVVELLAPAFDDTGLATAVTSAAATGARIYLFAGTDGRLVSNTSPGHRYPVAALVERVSASRIVAELLI